jgi:aspartate aminotransferase
MMRTRYQLVPAGTRYQVPGTSTSWHGHHPPHTQEYLPIEGNPEFCRLSRELAFGPACPQTKAGSIATVQTISGTGALRVGAEFLARHYPARPVLLPSPSWGNHRNVFAAAGLEVGSYRYYKPETRGLDFEVRWGAVTMDGVIV